MIIQFIILILGFIVLIKGADFFVDGASSIAKNLKIPDILIGLTIVAFGTSAPELAVSIKAALSQNSDMIIGNVVGSNILNILLILGIAACIAPLKMKHNTVSKEIPFLLLLSILLSVFLLDSPLDGVITNTITRTDGIAILLFFAIFIYYLFGVAKSDKGEKIEAKYTILKAIMYTLGGLVAIVLGGNFVVDSATNIATNLGVSDRFISLTIVAFGTSLPELVTSIVAVKKGELDISIGNVIGSNIFNICVVIGVPAAIFGNVTPKDPVGLDLIIMLLSLVVLYLISLVKKQVTRAGGIGLLMIFVVYYGYLIMTQIAIGA